VKKFNRSLGTTKAEQGIFTPKDFQKKLSKIRKVKTQAFKTYNDLTGKNP